MNVLIGFLPAWRAIPTAAAAGVQAAKQVADIAVQVAVAATAAAAGTPGAPAAYAAEQATKAAVLASMSSAITSMSGGADIHSCVTPVPVPPHGPGVVIDGSPTVLVNNLPASRLGDTIIEPLGPPNKIAKGEFTVIIGQSGSGGGGGGGGGGGAGGAGAGAGAGAGGGAGAGAGAGAAGGGAGAAGGGPGAGVAAGAQAQTLRAASREGRAFCDT
jgi:hypothetical protein